MEYGLRLDLFLYSAEVSTPPRRGVNERLSWRGGGASRSSAVDYEALVILAIFSFVRSHSDCFIGNPFTQTPIC
ncbi:hypothetical protein AAFF_G00337370 [Aldrovandia affinis]|uniref:Uncharacterized protein n=1 Tax=Aldrovandia affinis TaxID=143900 RepID=A0AAD7SL80_9TELE|nr:hypothetical protein AAFF_G00337370 [Aldrovandia affinis]